MVDVDSLTPSKHLQVQVEQYMTSQTCKGCRCSWGQIHIHYINVLYSLLESPQQPTLF